MEFSFLERFHSFQRYIQVFECPKIDDVTNRFSTKIHHKIKDISGSIGVMLLKLGTSNVPRVRHKMRPAVLLAWQPFCFRVYFMLIFCLNQT